MKRHQAIRNGSKRSGFSLLEVLLAMAMVALLTGGIFGFLWNIMDRRDALVAATAEAQAAGAFFEMLESDLACALVGDDVLGPGISGDSKQLKLMTRRVWAPATSRERDLSMGDLQFSEYRFDPGRGALMLRKWPVERAQGSDESTSGVQPSAQPEAVGERIEAMRIRYFDGRAWVPAFDSLEQRNLPVAVEVAIWFTRGSGGDRPVAAVNGRDDDPFEDGRMDEESEVPSRSPDRLRVIAVADGPTTWLKEAR